MNDIKLSYTCPHCGKEFVIGADNTKGCNCSYVPDLNSTPLKYKTPDATAVITTMMCNKCGGSGSNYSLKMLTTGDIVQIQRPCTECLGSGFIGIANTIEPDTK